MSLLDAVKKCGVLPGLDSPQPIKKAYSEKLSRHLAWELAEGLRANGFANVKPLPGGPGEKEFQGGLGPKKVDVSFADERHGLLLAISVKTITAAPFGKNLKNRFSDLCTEAITLHMRFPYSVICALFAFPSTADIDITPGRSVSTFQRATRLFGTISGRPDYTDPGEKFEHVCMLLFQPPDADGGEPWVKLVHARTRKELSEDGYFGMLREIYNRRNPHAPVGDVLEEED